MSLPFLKAESEENATQAAAFIGICIITVGLTAMNVTGAIAGSKGDSVGQLIIRGALAVILSGAELLAAVALVRVMLAPNWWRKLAGSLIFLGLAWACIQNGKRAVHLIYPEFAESAALLEARAEIADTEAKNLEEARSAAISAAPAELANIRSRIATLEGHQELMQARSPEKIMEAQTLLTVTGHYFGQIDGKRERLTESAMRAYGEEVGKELGQLRRQEANLSSGAVLVVPPVVGGEPVMTPAERKADLEDRARKAKAATIWLEVMLWVFEIARSFGLWALVTTITAKKKASDIIEREDAAVPDGKRRVEFTEQEWEEWQDAYDRHKKRKRAAEDKAPPGSPLRLDNKEWKRKTKQGIQDAYDQGKSPQEIADQFGFAWPEYENLVRRFFNKTAQAKYLGETAVTEPDPRAAVPPAEPEPEAAPDTDLDIPEEPKDYPVDFPRKPNGADDALPDQQ